MSQSFFGNFDLAQLALYLFWLFFAGLVIYLQRENMREGYPLEAEHGGEAPNQGPFPVPDSKTFHLPHGRGSVSVPSLDDGDKREIALEASDAHAGAPFVPTGDPMVDGVGPASWAERRDEPELSGHGSPKIVPMSSLEDFSVSSGRDPRGMEVRAADGGTVGKVSDMWVDEPEQLVRYLEVTLRDKTTRLIPAPLARIKSDGVSVHSLYAKNFGKIPQTKSAGSVTMLEEDQICGYFGGGKLYAAPNRSEPGFLR